MYRGELVPNSILSAPKRPLEKPRLHVSETRGIYEDITTHGFLDRPYLVCRVIVIAKFQMAQNQRNFRIVVCERYEIFGQAVLFAAVGQDEASPLGCEFEYGSTLLANRIAVLLGMNLDARAFRLYQHAMGLLKRRRFERIDHSPVAECIVSRHGAGGLIVAKHGIGLSAGHEPGQR